MNKLIAALCLFLSVCSGIVSVAQDKPSPAELTAEKLEAGPKLEAELNETWEKAAAITVATNHSPGNPGPDVELRAVHDGSHIWLMARWKDADKSDTKKAWSFNEGAWTQLEGDEDRFSVAINNNVEGFAEKGCGTLCHDGAMTTNVDGQTADLWHWKAARGGQNGYADDQHFNGEVEGRKDDEGKSTYSSNTNDAKTGPRWIWKEDADRQGVLSAETAREPDADFKPGEDYRVPSTLFRTPEGSRGDIQSAAAYKDGWWTVVLKRKLDTGNADDAKLVAGTTTHIAVAVFNNTGAKTGKEHSKSRVIRLTLK